MRLIHTTTCTMILTAVVLTATLGGAAPTAAGPDGSTAATTTSTGQQTDATPHTLAATADRRQHLGIGQTAQAARPSAAVHETTHATFVWDYGTRHGTSTHGVGGHLDFPMGGLPLRIFGGGALHVNNGNTRLYAGGGPGVRVKASDSIDVTAYLMLGVRNENRGYERTVFRSRAGGGIDYRFGEQMSVHAGAAYDKAFHLLAGFSAAF